MSHLEMKGPEQPLKLHAECQIEMRGTQAEHGLLDCIKVRRNPASEVSGKYADHHFGPAL